MDGRVFYDHVAAHEGLEWLGARQGLDPGTDEVYVGHESGAEFAVPVSSILSHEWDELEEILAGRRQAKVLNHLTRIVGYFSQVRNWNRSKLAELRDRQAGAYTLPEPASSMVASPGRAVRSTMSSRQGLAPERESRAVA